MDLPKEAISEYIQIASRYGEDLDVAQATQQAERLLNGWDLILQLQDKEDHETNS